MDALYDFILHPLNSSFKIAIVITAIGLLGLLILLKVNTNPSKKKKRLNSRFRSRDKVLFIGKKVIRTIKQIKEHIKSRSIYKKNKKQILRRYDSIRELSGWFEETPELEYPEEIYFVGRIIKKLFHFERPIFLKIFKSLINKSIEKDDILFDYGKTNEAIYVIQSGSVGLYYKDNNFCTLLKVFYAGDSIFSLLHILESLIIGKDTFVFELQAKALEKSSVHIVASSIFHDIYKNQIALLIRLIQNTLLRLQTVNFNTLYETFGLVEDLLVQKEENISYPNSFESAVSPPCEYSENIPVLLDPLLLQGTVSSACSANFAFFKSCDSPNEIPLVSNETTIQLNIAVDEVCKLLGEHIRNLLQTKGTVHSYKENSYIVKTNDRETSLYFVISGSLKKTIIDDTSNGNESTVYICNPGTFCGILAILTGHHSIFNIKTESKAIVFSISRTLFQLLIRESPKIVKILAKVMLSRLSPFVRNTDFALDCEQYEASHPLYRQASISDKIYVVLNGRLRSYHETNGTMNNILGEFGRNDLIGIVEVLEKTPRISTVFALRNSEVVIIPAAFMYMIQKTRPQIMTKIANFLSKRIVKLHSEKENNYIAISNYSTIALLPTTPRIPIKNFTFELNQALNQIRPTTVVDGSIFKMLKWNPLLSKIQAHQIITQLETGNVIILWQGEPTFSNWTKHCIRNADLILVIALSTDSCKLTALEKQINDMEGIKAQQHLVLLHKLDFYTPSSNTTQWLNCRTWISEHHHIRCSDKVYSNICFKKIYTSNPSLYRIPGKNSDISRLARRITNTSVGLVLGGGGARGYSHIGVIRALEEEGIPIDMIGGASMGAFMGGAYALNQNSTELLRKANKFVELLGGFFKQLTDFTLPLVAILSGSRFNWVIRSVFKERNIEDLLIPYYCVTSDLTNCSMRIHKCGCLWRYVRGSMSLTNILPPICDPKDNHLLVDGGYCNFLPADVMFGFGAKYVIAVDVSSTSDEVCGNYGDEISGWKLLFNKINPFAKKIIVPGMQDIQFRLSFLKSVNAATEVQKLANLIYIRPPVSMFTTLQFSEHERITTIGYNFMKELLSNKNTNNLEYLSSLVSTNDDESDKLISFLKVTLVNLVDLSSYASSPRNQSSSTTESGELMNHVNVRRSNSLGTLDDINSSPSEVENDSDGYASDLEELRFN